VGNSLKTTPFILALNVTSAIFTTDLYWNWMKSNNVWKQRENICGLPTVTFGLKGNIKLEVNVHAFTKKYPFNCLNYSKF